MGLAISLMCSPLPSPCKRFYFSILFTGWLKFSLGFFLLTFLSLLYLHALTSLCTLGYLQYVLMRTGVQSVGGFKLNAVFKSASEFVSNAFFFLQQNKTTTKKDSIFLLYSQVCLRICSLNGTVGLSLLEKMRSASFLVVPYYIFSHFKDCFPERPQSPILKKGSWEEFLIHRFYSSEFHSFFKRNCKKNNPLPSDGKRTGRQKYKDIYYFFEEICKPYSEQDCCISNPFLWKIYMSEFYWTVHYLGYWRTCKVNVPFQLLVLWYLRYLMLRKCLVKFCPLLNSILKVFCLLTQHLHIQRAKKSLGEAQLLLARSVSSF